jgi:hypothetical protein
MDWDSIILGIIGLFGGGFAVKAVEGYNNYRLKKLDNEAKDDEAENRREDTAMTVLQRALDNERADHKETLKRLSSIERSLDARELEWKRLHDECRKENRELQRSVDKLRDALMASFLDEPERAKKLVEESRTSSPPKK